MNLRDVIVRELIWQVMGFFFFFFPRQVLRSVVARERSMVLVSALFTFIAYGQRTECYAKDKHVIATLNGGSQRGQAGLELERKHEGTTRH